MFYTTIENQFREDGSYGLLYDHFTDEAQAKAKFFTICAAAAVSDIPYHSAHLLASDGRMIRQEIFDRRVEETTPETEQETTLEPKTEESLAEG